MDAVKLFERYTMAELVTIQQEIIDDPDNRNPPGTFRIYKDGARRKMKEITWAIQYHLDSKGRNT